MKYILIIFSFFLIGCANNKISGIYLISDNKICNESIKIELKKDSFFIYEGVNLKGKGIYKLIEDNSNTYLQMNSIEGLYKRDSIIIQNYGNSMNEFVLFSECDAKYLYFIKQQ